MRFTLMALLLGGVALVPQVASAQSSLAPRVDKLEGEMRAVQRKVFPGGSGQSFEPQIRSEEDVNRASPGTPASSPVADLEARVNALESQLSSLTGQIETTQHRTQQLDDAFNAYKRSTDARLKALEDGAAATGGAGDGTGDPAPVGDGSPRTSRPVTPSGAVSRPTASREPSKPSPRASAAADIEKPSTGEAAEDAYVYGYRLWQAKAYPEAEAQFKLVVANYPRHKRASYAQNMLGRTYLDEGKPSLASIAFYDNYKKMPDGDRAPDSLYNLAGALMKLNKPADACKVYGELSDVYAGKITDGMRADIARGRTEAKCAK